MTHRKLRIAWSALWGLACVLLLALWVRSYWRHLSVTHYSQPGGTSMSLSSSPGGIEFGTTTYVWPFGNPFGKDWHFFSATIQPDEFKIRTIPFVFIPNTSGGRDILVPFWLPTLICTALAAIPWIRRNFSLRTLLLATTFVALLLGMIV